MTVHTPTPWFLAGSEIHDRPTTYDANGARTGSTPNSIAEVHVMPFGEQDANAAFIVHACNNHARLVEVLEEVLEERDRAVRQFVSMKTTGWSDKARAVIAAAKGD